MIDRHIAKLKARGPLSPDEEQAIRSSIAEVREIPADQIAVHANVDLDCSTLLLNGILCRFKDLSSGQRQITELHIPGDFADLHSFTLKYLDHDVMALTRCRLATVPHAALRRITEQFPRLTRLYWFTTNVDAAIHREWELSLGRRTARERLASLFCELEMRLGVVGLADSNGFDLPLTQTDIAECTGLTNVHVNRVLRDLKTDGLLEFKSGRARILDRKGLRDAGDFDSTYLYLDRRDR